MSRIADYLIEASQLASRYRTRWSHLGPQLIESDILKGDVPEYFVSFLDKLVDRHLEFFSREHAKQLNTDRRFAETCDLIRLRAMVANLNVLTLEDWIIE